MKHGQVFKTDRSQAVRPPKAGALLDDVDLVDIIVVGRTRVVTPPSEMWDNSLYGPHATPYFMSERNRREVRERETL